MGKIGHAQKTLRQDKSLQWILIQNVQTALSAGEMLALHNQFGRTGKQPNKTTFPDLRQGSVIR